jgi:hypothetical protein
VGFEVKVRVGLIVGLQDGKSEGVLVGIKLSENDGEAEGSLVGVFVGDIVGGREIPSNKSAKT